MTQEIQKLDKHAQAIVQYEVAALAMEVTSDDTLSGAALFVKDLRSQTNQIESDRKELVKPFNDGVKAINSKARALIAPLNTIKSAIERKMLSYQDKKREEEARERREAEAAALEAAQKAEEEDRHADAEKIIEKAVEVKPKKTEAVSAPEVTTTVRKTWKFEVINPGEVPRVYLTIDEGKIRLSVKDGARNIPGVRIYEDRKTIVL